MTSLLKKLSKRFLLVGVEVGGDLPDEIAAFAEVFHFAALAHSDFALIELMLAVLKLQEISGESVGEVSGLESFHVSCFQFVGLVSQDSRRGARATA